MKSKKKNIFIMILKVCVVLFLVLYVLLENGYYEKNLAKKAVLTEEYIRKFEEDVKNNKIVDVSNYKIEEDVDYSNGISRMGQKITDSFGEVIIKGSQCLVDILKTLFW